MENRKCALVTGASSNCGQGIAVSLAAKGYDVAITYSENKAGAEDTIKMCEAYGVRCEAFQAQLNEADAPEKLIKEVCEAFGRLDALICNAGRSCQASILSSTYEELKDIYNLDYRGYMLCAKGAAKYMIQNDIKGNFIFITSSQGEQAYPGGFLYCGIKAAINQSCKSLAMDLSHYGIRVNVVAPGEVRSYSKHPSPKKVRMHTAHGTPEKSFKRLEDLNALPFTQGNVPLKRVGEPKDMGDAVAFLISEEASFITGIVLRVDGGLILPGALQSEAQFIYAAPDYWKQHREKAYGSAERPKREMPLKEQKHAVILTDHTDVESIAGKLKDYEISIVPREDYVAGIDVAHEKFGRVDLLIIDHREPVSGSILNATADSLDKIYREDFCTCILAAGVAVRHMIRDGIAGEIMFLIRNHGKRAAVDTFANDGMDAAMEHAVRCIAMDVGHYGIRVNCIAIEPKIGKTNPENIPLQNNCDKRNLSSLVAFLAGEEAGCMTGDTISADYGASLPTALEADEFIRWYPEKYWEKEFQKAFQDREEA